MLRRLRQWLIKRLGGYTPLERYNAYAQDMNDAPRRVQLRDTWRGMEEMSDYLNQHHDAGFDLGFGQGVRVERRTHSCEEAYQDGFEEGAWFVLDTMDEAATLYGRMDDRIMMYKDFRDAFLEVRNG